MGGKSASFDPRGLGWGAQKPREQHLTSFDPTLFLAIHQLNDASCASVGEVSGKWAHGEVPKDVEELYPTPHVHEQETTSNYI